jgi:hypothetical protein
MNQDSYIYRRMNLGEIGESDVFARTIVQCCDPENESKLDPDIVSLWEGMLADVHPDLFDTNPPDSASWHHEFISRVFECSLKKVQLFPLAANISAKMALTYPEYDKVDHQFIEEQVVPKESPICLHFDTIFDRAVSNTGVMWRLVEQAVCAYNQASSPRFGDWNLDNGRDEHGRLVLW